MKYFLLIGKTGVGKSSFVNSCFGTKIAEVSCYEACTKLVKHYTYNCQFGNACIIDTPGLCEDDEYLDNKYIALIKADKEIPKILL